MVQWVLRAGPPLLAFLSAALAARARGAWMQWFRVGAMSFLMLNCVFTCVGQLMGLTAVAAGHASVPLRVNCAASACNVVACFVFIPIWGIPGAVAAQLVGSVLAVLIYGFKLTQFKFPPNMLEIGVPLCVGILLASVYEASALDHVSIRIGFLGAYVVLCWFLLPELRKLARIVFDLVADFGKERLSARRKSEV